MEKLRDEQGITLVALVITVIILLILAAITINGLVGENGIITRAKEAKISTELANYKEEVQLYKLTKTSENSSFVGETLTAGKTDLNYNTKGEEDGNIKTIIPDISDTYLEKLEVIKGELLINTQDKNEIRVAQRLGIEVNPYDIRDGVLWSSNGNLLLMDENTGSLTIPDSVTAIGEGAFSNLDGLRTIIIPPTVKRIEQNAFKNNTTLENVIIQTRDGQGVEYIGVSAFEGCKSLQTITLPDTITNIGSRCFAMCTKLDNIKLSDSLLLLADELFVGCNNLKNLELPRNLQKLGAQCLTNTGLSKIKFPKSLETIGTRALEISRLKEIDTSENDYFEFKNGALYNKDLNTLFLVLSNITSINIDNKVETIKSGAFSLCNQLTTINIPSGVTTIEGNVFSNQNLKNITVDSLSTSFKTDTNGNLYSCDGKVLYRLFDTGDVTIQTGVENIKTGAIIDNGKIKSLVLPDSYIGDNGTTWNIFPTLDYLILPKNVKTFDKRAYNKIKTIKVSEDNPYFESINDEYLVSEDGTALYWVKSDLTNIDIPETVTTIKTMALMLTKANIIKLPENITKIEDYMVYNSSSVKKIEIQSKIETISSLAFSGLNNLKEVIIHKKNDGTLTGSPWGCIYGDKAIIWDE